MLDTQYSDLSQEQLNDLFHSSSWDHLSADERLAACQEMHNRYADEHGMERVGLVPVEMQGTSFGAYDPGSRCIELNRSVLESGEIVTTDGERIAYSGGNAETLDTVFHETSHAYDHQLCEAVKDQQAGEEANRRILEDASLRGLDVDLIRASDSIYISSSQNPDLYRVQDCEKRAYEIGESETAKAFEDSTSRLGEDNGYQDYTERLELNDSYDTSLSNLKRVYNDEDIDQTLNEQTKHLYYNETDQGDASGTYESRTAISNELRSTHGGFEACRANVYGYQAEHYGGYFNSADSYSKEAGNSTLCEMTNGQSALCQSSSDGSSSDSSSSDTMSDENAATI